MLEKVIFHLILVLCFSSKGYSQDAISLILSENISVDSLDDFSFLDSLIGNRKIIILGETGHGDGKTFEVKSKIVEYLNKNKGFNTIALEGSGFLDMELYKGVIEVGEIDGYNFRSLQDTWAGVWSFSKETKILQDLIRSKKITPIGIDATTTFDNFYLPIIIERMLNFQYNKIDLNFIHDFNNKLFSFNPEIKIANNEISKLKKQFNLIKKQLKSTLLPNNYGIINQALDNYLVLVNQYQQNWFSDEGINKNINKRDKQMFNNLLWHLKQNPNHKIIVWTANFHATRNINNIIYKEGEKNIYADFVLLGDYIYKKFPHETYSIAFTSSEGTFGRYYEEPKAIHTPIGTLENALKEQSLEYLFIPLSLIRLSNSKSKKMEFNSQILGYDNKPGKWINCYDGIFYIKSNYNATLAD